MSRSGQAFVAATRGHKFTLYAVMRLMGIPLSKEQEKFQAYLERTYPVVEEETNELPGSEGQTPPRPPQSG